MRAHNFTNESAVEELKNKLPSLKNTSYDTIDELMQKISRRYKLTGKKLHDLFVHKYGHTPDTWIKKIKNRLSEYGDEIVAEGPIQKDYPQYGGKDPNKTMTYDRLVGPGYAGEPWSDSTDNWSGEEGPKLPPNTKPTIRLSDKFGNEADYAVDSPQAKQVYANRMQKYGADVNGPVMKALTTAFSKPVDRSKVKTIGQSDSTSDFTDSGLDNEIIPSKVIKPTTSSNTDTDNVDNDDKPMRIDTRTGTIVPVEPVKTTLKPADALGPGEEEIPPSTSRSLKVNPATNRDSNSTFYTYKSPSSQTQPVKPITPSSSTAKPPKPGSWQELATLNKITDPTKLQAGQRLQLPGGSSIPVNKGDTLSSIAKSLATTGQPPSQINPKPTSQQAGAGRGQQGGATADQLKTAAQTTSAKPPIAPTSTSSTTANKNTKLNPSTISTMQNIVNAPKSSLTFPPNKPSKLTDKDVAPRQSPLSGKNPQLQAQNESATNRLTKEFEVFLKYQLTEFAFDKKPLNHVTENQTAAGINNLFANLGDPVFSNLQRVALLAMQGRQNEASSRLQSVIKDANPVVQKKIIDAVNNIKPVTINGKIADSSTLDKSKQHKEWIIKTFIPWVQSLLKQGVSEAVVKEDVSTKDNVQQIKDFIKWSMKTLNIKSKPKFTLSKNTEEAQTGHHTGVHSGDRIWIYIGNRNLIDIFRTIFHELVHQRQEELNMIKDGDSYPGSPIEAMADMMAGKYIKIYSKDHPEIFQ